MTDDRQPDRTVPGNGPFPQKQPDDHPWEAYETERGPFERRRAGTRSTSSSTSDDEARSGRRRWGRRKSDLPTGGSRKTVPGGGRSLVQRLRTPLIGVALAGMAVPLVNATAPMDEAATEKDTAEGVGESEVEADRDLDEEVGDYWADAEEDVVRSHTIEGAATRWDIDRGLAEKIYDYATKHDIEPDVAYGLVFTESTFRDRAVSHVGARGLTQLMPRTAKWLDPGVSTRDLYDPDVNLDLGFRYLRQLIDKYEGDVENALTAYNRGPGTVDRILDRGGNPDNGYAGKVLAG